MFGIGFQEVLIILVVALIIFGPKRLPELARMLGRGLAEFRKATNDLKNAVELEEIRELHRSRIAEATDASDENTPPGGADTDGSPDDDISGETPGPQVTGSEGASGSASEAAPGESDGAGDAGGEEPYGTHLAG